MFVLVADKTRLTVKSRELLTSRSVNIYEVEFIFSDDWTGLNKIAVFKNGYAGQEVSVPMSVIQGHCHIPWEVLVTSGDILYAGVYGTNEDGQIVLPTIWTNIGRIREGAKPGPGELPVPTPELWEQELGKKGDTLQYTGDGKLGLYAGNVLLSSVEIRIPEGIDGSTFIPHISKEGILSWTNDGNLPNPDPVNVIGPRGADGKDGPAGPKGDPGEQGPQGPQGVQGLQGLQGVQGPKGDTGAQGPAGKDGATGPKGDKGDPGQDGAQGPQGVQGEQGPKGDKGDPGKDGPKGDKGDPGPQGVQGPAGKDGAPGPKGDTGDPGPKGDPGVLAVTRAEYNALSDEEKMKPIVYQITDDPVPLSEVMIEENTQDGWRIRKWSTGYVEMFYLGPEVTPGTVTASGSVFYFNMGKVSYPFTLTKKYYEHVNVVGSSAYGVTTLARYDTDSLSSSATVDALCATNAPQSNKFRIRIFVTGQWK